MPNDTTHPEANGHTNRLYQPGHVALRGRDNGKNWLIQCWKGRYGITTGAEIGVYNKEAGSSRSIYSTVTDDERLELGMVVHDKTKLLFERPVQTHWWMTGFLLNYYTLKYI